MMNILDAKFSSDLKEKANIPSYHGSIFSGLIHSGL